MSKYKIYKLNELVPCDNNCIISVVGKNNYLYMVAPEKDITWKKLIEKSVMNFKERKHCCSCKIIIERPTNGIVYEFGNYDKTYIYQQGETYGYA